jgi:hypothetical protein
VVVNDFDFVGIAIPPFKADSVLAVDSQTPLALSVTLQPLQPISGRGVQLLNRGNSVNLPKLAKRHPLNCRMLPAMAVMENLLRIFIGKRADHA